MWKRTHRDETYKILRDQSTTIHNNTLCVILTWCEFQETRLSIHWKCMQVHWTTSCYMSSVKQLVTMELTHIMVVDYWMNIEKRFKIWSSFSEQTIIFSRDKCNKLYQCIFSTLFNKREERQAIPCLHVTKIDLSIWINVHICSTEPLKSFDVLQIDNASVRQPYFIKEMFSDF